ncbi:MAG: hypothetical protein EHM89_05990 [Acidobacteria bacterium]|nr:MAG: hypothetical protein EHM89_05990 [Acidobacteriota bacterium]
MIDIIGAISLTAIFGLCSAVLIGAVPVETASRMRLSVLALAWFAAVAVIAATGVFSVAGIGTPLIGLAVLMPVVVFLVSAMRSPAVRSVALHTPLPALVGIHAARVLGVFFVLLFEAGRLPPTFALTAGWGDIAVAVGALPLAWAIRHPISGWRPLTFAWNLLGFADLVTAVTLGVGSAADSPVRFIYETPNSGAVAALPWVLIPAVLVPVYLITHLAVFAQLARTTAVVTRKDRHLAVERHAI